MSHYETKHLETLERIAAALERLVVCFDEGRAPPAPTGSTVTAVPVHTFTSPAVEALKAMPDDIPPEPAPPAVPVKKPEVVAALNRVAKAHGVKAGLNVLASFGATRLDQVPEDRWPEVVATCNQLAGAA